MKRWFNFHTLRLVFYAVFFSVWIVLLCLSTRGVFQRLWDDGRVSYSLNSPTWQSLTNTADTTQPYQNEPWARKGKESDDCFHMVTLYTWLKDAPGIQIGLPKGGFVWYGRREIGQVLPLIKGLRDRICKKKGKEEKE